MGDFERVKESVRLQDFAETHLQRAARGNKYVCPACNSGGHGSASSDSAFSITQDGQHFECFACEESGDIYDLAGIVFKTQERKEQLQAVASWAGIALEGSSNSIEQRSVNWNAQDKQDSITQDKQAAPDYTKGRMREAARIQAAQAAINTESGKEAISYLIGRGFTADEIERFGFGWDAQAQSIVIPYRGCDYYHIDRDITGEAKHKYTKPAACDVGEQPLENPDALMGGSVYIVEGLLDALAVEAMGQHSIAMGGTSSDKALREIASQGYGGIVVIMLDGDEAGRKAAAKAAERAEALGLRYHIADFTAVTGCKDACEALQADRAAARAALNTIKAEAVEACKAAQKSSSADDDAALGIHNPAAIAEDIYTCEGYEEPTPTGLTSLDRVTSGGLRSGLTVLGATSSAGKTTLCVQLADYIAEHGRPVLFVTIEQSGRELVSKSLSRLMADRGYKSVPAWAMNSPKERETWTDTKVEALVGACNEYVSKIAPNLVYLSANEQPTVAQVEAAARRIQAARGVSPVVFLDYLQLLAPKDERDTDKRAADYNVSQLRRLARDIKSPVVAISSLNRTGYNGSIEMESFKESGGIEYGADVLLGLQPYNMEARMNECKTHSSDARVRRAKDITNEFKRQAMRACEIVVLKNRNGAIPPKPLPVTFDCASSLFTEGTGGHGGGYKPRRTI